MKKVCFLLAATCIIPTLFAQTKNLEHTSNVEILSTEVIRFKSAINKQDYVLDIYLPSSYNSSTKKFPVLYVLDGQWSFPYIAGIQGVPEGLYYDGLAPEMIVVGIKWSSDYEKSRQRDFTPTSVKEFPNSGGASAFLSIIENEIMNKIDSGYRTDKVNNSFTGGSLGGLFILYTLFHKPTLFNRYIVWGFDFDYDNQYIFKAETSFAEKSNELNARLFICNNEYEEEMTDVSNFKKFISQLKSHHYKGFELESLLIEKVGHVSEGPYAVGRGLEFVFRQPDIAVDTMLLERYTGHYQRNEEIMTVTRSGSRIYINFPGGKIKLYAKTTDSFYAKGFEGGIGQFVIDSSGKVTGYKIISENVTIPYQKID